MVTFNWLHEFADFLYSFVGINHLAGNSRYHISKLIHSEIADQNMFRSYANLTESYGKFSGSGVAEASTLRVANIRSLAEAYEQICFKTFSGYEEIRRLKAPYGLGCSISPRIARLRAYGEYYERLSYLSGATNLKHSGADDVMFYTTPAGAVYVRKIESCGSIGTGCGNNRSQALDSAKRSCLRKRDFPNPISLFNMPEQPAPVVVSISPAQHPWVSCYLAMGYSTYNLEWNLLEADPGGLNTFGK